MSEKYRCINEFQAKYPTKGEREEALRNMTVEHISELIDATPNIQAKIYYSRFIREKGMNAAKRLIFDWEMR